jgi:hypothetical protein
MCQSRGRTLRRHLLLPIAATLLASASGADIGMLQKAVEKETAPVANAAAAVNPHGQPYGPSSARWWQWVFSLPVHDAQNNFSHPLLTSGAVNCAAGQSGNVWFLAGNLSGGPTVRNCSIPQGTALLLPVLNAWCDNTASPHPRI